MRHCDSIWTDLALVTMRRGSLEVERGMMIAAHQGKIVHVGRAREIVDFSTDHLEECDGQSLKKCIDRWGWIFSIR